MSEKRLSEQIDITWSITMVKGFVDKLEALISRLRQEREIAVGYLDTTLMREYEKDVKALGGEG